MAKEKNVIFYHYTSVDGLFGIIEYNCLHATNISYMNDPSEEEYFQIILKKFLSQNNISNKTYSTLYNNSYKNVFDNPEKYIISFSELSDSLPMWNYYSKGNGYNLGLRLDHIIKRAKEQEYVASNIVHIIYDENEQLKILSRFFTKHEKVAIKYHKLSVQVDECQRSYNKGEYQLLT